MSWTRTIAAIALLSALIPLTAGRAAGDAPIDVIFVTDDSPSMGRNDPAGVRTRLMKALCDLLLHRGGDRVAVLRLGGALESEESGLEVFPLREVPAAVAEKSKLLFDVKAAFDSRLPGFGRGSDFNRLFETGVFKLLRERADTRKAFVVLVTDGAMDVIEGDRVHGDYRKAVEGQAGGMTREALNDAALRRFRTAVLPILEESGISLIPVALRMSPAAGSAVLSDLAALKGGSDRVIELGDDPDACAAAIIRCIGAETGYVQLGGPQSLRIDPGAEVSRDMWIPMEASATRILVLADTAEFTISFTDVSGSALGSEEGLDFFGANEQHRVIVLGRQAIPNRILKLSNRGTKPAAFGVHAMSKFEIAPRARVMNADKTASAGGTIVIEAALVTMPDETPVRDRWLIERSTVDVSVIDSSGEKTELTRGFGGAESALKTIEIPISKDAAGGIYLIRIEPRIVTDAGGVSTGAVEDQIRVVAAKTVVKAEFLSPNAFPGMEVGIAGTVESGKVESGSLVVRVSGKDPSAGAMEAELKWDPDRRVFAGSLKFPETGAYRIEGSSGAVEVVSGPGGGLEVSERKFTVLDSAGRPLQGITFNPSADGSYQEQVIEIAANLASGEEGGFTITSDLRPDLGGAALEILRDGRAVKDQDRIVLNGSSPRQKLTMRLKAGGDGGPSGEIGTFRVKGLIGGASMTLDKFLRAVAPPPGRIEKQAFYKDPKLIAAAASVGGLLLIGLVYWLLLPRFKSEYVIELDPATGEPGEGTLVRDLRRGFSPGRASGMPGVKNSVEISLKGLRAFSRPVCLAKPLKPFIQLHVNGKVYLGPTQLRHGDHMKLRGARFTREYVFFTSHVTDDDWKEFVDRIAAEKAAPARAEAGTAAEAPAGEPAAAAAAGAVSAPPEAGEAAAQLNSIFGTGPGAQPEQAKAEPPPEKPKTRKVVTLEDFFGSEAAEKVRVEEGHAEPKQPAAAAPPGAGAKEETSDEEATVIETFFGSKDKPAGGKAGPEAGAPASDRPADVLDKLFGVEAGAPAPGGAPETVDEIIKSGDRTEIVESSEPAPFPGDRTEVVSGDIKAQDESEFFEVSEEEEPAIEVPAKPGKAEPAGEAGPSGEAGAEEIPAELRETQVEGGQGILTQAFEDSGGEPRRPAEGKQVVEIREDEEEDVEIIESGEAFESYGDQQTILETAFGEAMKDGGAPPAHKAEGFDQIVIADEWEARKIAEKNKGKDAGTGKRS